MKFKNKSRNTVYHMLRNAGYNWTEFNEDGSILYASKTAAGITIMQIIVSFSSKGRAINAKIIDHSGNCNNPKITIVE